MTLKSFFGIANDKVKKLLSFQMQENLTEVFLFGFILNFDISSAFAHSDVH